MYGPGESDRGGGGPRKCGEGFLCSCCQYIAGPGELRPRPAGDAGRPCVGIGIGTGPGICAGPGESERGGAGKTIADEPLDGCDGPLPTTEKAGLEGGAPVAVIGILARLGPRA